MSGHAIVIPEGTELVHVPPDEPPTVVAALSAVMGDVQAVGKTGRNEQQGFDFRGIDAVVNAVGPALRRHGVIVLPRVLAATYGDFNTKNGTLMHTATLEVEFTFIGPRGDRLKCSAMGESADAGDKASAKAHSVAFRTALLQALCIPTDEPDPDGTTYERRPDPLPVRRAWVEVKSSLVDKLTRGNVENPTTTAQAIWADHTPASPDVTDDELNALLNAVTDRIAEAAAAEPDPEQAP